MTRFMRELNGELGPYWVKSANKELEETQAALDSGDITIDAAGIARNCIGRVLMSDMLEKVALLTSEVNVEETEAARAAEVSADLAEYRASRQEPSEEELMEMQAAFGAGTIVVDVLSGRQIKL